MTASMWNSTLDCNELNKRESFMTGIIKVNPIQVRHFQASQKLRVGRGHTKKLMLVLEKWNLEKGFKSVWKSTSSVKFYLPQQLLLEISKVT